MDTSPEAVAYRQSRALEMRQNGKTFQAIANELGYATPQGASYAVKAALKAHVPHDMGLDWQAQLARLDALMAALWPAAKEGDPQAVNAFSRLEERRVRVLAAMGHCDPLPAPQKAPGAAGGGPGRPRKQELTQEAQKGAEGTEGASGEAPATGLSEFERRLKERDHATPAVGSS